MWVPLKDEGFTWAGRHDSGITSVLALSKPVLTLVSSRLEFFEQLLLPRLSYERQVRDKWGSVPALVGNSHKNPRLD